MKCPPESRPPGRFGGSQRLGPFGFFALAPAWLRQVRRVVAVRVGADPDAQGLTEPVFRGRADAFGLGPRKPANPHFARRTDG